MIQHQYHALDLRHIPLDFNFLKLFKRRFNYDRNLGVPRHIKCTYVAVCSDLSNISSPSTGTILITHLPIIISSNGLFTAISKIELTAQETCVLNKIL